MHSTVHFHPYSNIALTYTPPLLLLVQAIPAGTEASISYIDLDLPVGARRSELQRCFNFLCQCPKCMQEVENGSAKVSWSRSVSARGKKEDKQKSKGRGKHKKKH